MSDVLRIVINLKANFNKYSSVTKLAPLFCEQTVYTYELLLTERQSLDVPELYSLSAAFKLKEYTLIT